MADQIFGVDDVWAIAEGQIDDQPLIIRYRSGLDKLAGDPRVPKDHKCRHSGSLTTSGDNADRR